MENDCCRPSTSPLIEEDSNGAPDHDPFVLHLFAALAEKERRLISERPRAGLAAARDGGAKVGTRGRNASRLRLEKAGKASAA